MPALMEAYKLSSRAAHVGFDWPNMDGLFEKLQEETEELQQGLEEFPAPGPRPHSRGIAGAGKQQVPEALRQHLEEEVGDLFFVLVNIARYLSLDPESALSKTNRKFKRRFQWMEEQLRAPDAVRNRLPWPNWNLCGNRPRAEDTEDASRNEREAG